MHQLSLFCSIFCGVCRDKPWEVAETPIKLSHPRRELARNDLIINHLWRSLYLGHGVSAPTIIPYIKRLQSRRNILTRFSISIITSQSLDLLSHSYVPKKHLESNNTCLINLSYYKFISHILFQRLELSIINFQ
jgi:hypothetical protein